MSITSTYNQNIDTIYDTEQIGLVVNEITIIALPKTMYKLIGDLVRNYGIMGSRISLKVHIIYER